MSFFFKKKNTLLIKNIKIDTNKIITPLLLDELNFSLKNRKLNYILTSQNKNFYFYFLSLYTITNFFIWMFKLKLIFLIKNANSTSN